MNSKRVESFCLALAIPVFMLSSMNAHAAASEVVVLSPTTLQSYTVGDAVRVQWTSDFSPALRQPMVVSLLGPKFKRIRIGSVVKRQNNGIYSVTWKIPQNFFNSHKFTSEAIDFRIEIRQGGSLRNRFIGKGNQIRIQKEAPAQRGDGNAESVIPSPGATLTDRSRLVARYEFKSLLEPWVVQKLTVVNDTANDGFDSDLGETTDAVERVLVRYPDALGALKIVAVPYANGKAAFSGLDFYIPSRGTAMLELYVEAVDPAIGGEQFSGKTFRMGIQEVSNNASTFEAVGQISDTTIHSLASLQVTSSSINESVVKAGVLDFALVGDQPRALFNGENNVFDFTVTSKSASLGRLVFDVGQGGLAAVGGVKFTRNGTPLTAGDASQFGDVYLMWDSGPSSCFAQLAQGGASTGMDCNGAVAPSSKLIVAFSKEEIISGTTTFGLSFNVAGVGAGDGVWVRLSQGDDFAKPVMAGSDSLNAKIFNAGVDPELFANPTDFASEATSISDRNIIWSDRSADLHAYPGLSPAALLVSNAASSADWTNGYLLGLNALPAVISQR